MKNPFDFAPAFVKATAGRQDRSIRSFTFRTTSAQDDNYATLVNVQIKISCGLRRRIFYKVGAVCEFK